MERQKQMQGKHPQGNQIAASVPTGPISDNPKDPTYCGPDGEPGSDIHRRQCVRAYQDVMGISWEQATKIYDGQMKQWESGDW